MPRKKKDDPDRKTTAAPAPAETSMTPEEVTKPERPIPKEAAPSAPAPEAPPQSAAEQAKALAEAKDRPAELARQKAAYNPQRVQPTPSGELRLSARQFVRARKLQWRHAAGFLMMMKRELGPMAKLTIKEWTVHWDECQTRPIAGPRRRS